MPRRLMSLRTETPIAFVQAVMHAYARYGVDPAAALQAARIRPEQLDNPEARIIVNPPNVCVPGKPPLK